MKRDQRLQVYLPLGRGNPLERKVSDVVAYLKRSDYPVGTAIVHHRASGGKTWYKKVERLDGKAVWTLERVTYA